MVKVSLILKTFDKKSNESKKETIDSKEFPKPKKYEQFISDIIKSFKIKNKKDITLMVYTIDEDENPIHDQQDLDDYEALEYRVILEKDESSDKKLFIPSSSEEKSKDKKSNKNEKSKDKEEDKINDEPESEKEEDEIDEEPDDEMNINIKVNMEISDKEIEQFIEGQIKVIPEIDNQNINDDIQFDIEEYKKELNNKNINIIKNFNNSLDNKINNIVINKSNFMKESIKNSIINFSNIHIEEIKKINNETKGLKEEFDDMISNSSQMNIGLEKIKEGIESGKMINTNPSKNPSNIEENPNAEINHSNQIENHIGQINPSNKIINPNEGKKHQNNLNNIEEEEIFQKNQHKLTIKFEKENLDLEISIFPGI